MSKVKGGPKTEAGKAISSQNSLKHGALSKKFHTPSEQEQYEALLKSLKARYAQSDPIIGLELERIASSKVQLDRIQRSIDSVYAGSQSWEEKAQSVGQYLGMTESEIRALSPSSIKAGMLDLNIVSKKTKLVVEELSSIQWEDFKSPQDFLDSAPLFCEYLVRMAEESGHTINHFSNQIENSLEIESVGYDLKRRIKSLSDQVPKDDVIESALELSLIEKSISEANTHQLKEAANIIIVWHKKIMEKNYRKTLFHHLMQIQDNSIGLNLDSLDKFYRYQTSAQRQLSSVIGELMILDKSITNN